MKVIGIFFLLSTIFLRSSNNELTTSSEQPIVFLIATPRSSSTAFLRMIEARNDFICFQEPFDEALRKSLSKNSVDCYHEVFGKTLHKDVTFLRNKTEKSYKIIKETLLKTAEEKSVFIKEISWVVEDFLLYARDFTLRKNVHFVFLIRNPHGSVCSFYRACGNQTPDPFSYLVGYESLYNLYKALQKIAVNPVIVFKTEDLYENLEGAARHLCKQVQVPFKEEMLEWPRLKSSWADVLGMKEGDLNHAWFGTVVNSSKFEQKHTYEIDKIGNPTFTEIINLNDRKKCQQAYNENFFYYDLLLKEFNALKKG